MLWNSILVNKQAGSLSSVQLGSSVNFAELSWIGQLSERVELEVEARSVSSLSSLSSVDRCI